MSEYRIDAEAGIVYGKQGKPIRKRCDRGYVIVYNGHLSDGGIFVAKAHRMIWESVHGPIPTGLQINHINGIKHDNRIVNLELVTASENAFHKFRIGLACAKGPLNGRAIGKRRRLQRLLDNQPQRNHQ